MYYFRTAGHRVFEKGIMSQTFYDKCHIWSVAGQTLRIHTHIQSCVPTLTHRESLIASLPKPLIRLSL